MSDLPKYEYAIKTWGGFYNDENKAKHGLSEGSFWFDNEPERNRFLSNLKSIEAEYNAKYLAYALFEGHGTRLETIAMMTLVYQGVEYPFSYDFGFGYDPESARYMFEDGNYSCDCNRSLFLNRELDGIFPELTCGNEIEMKDFKIEYRHYDEINA